MLYQRTDDLGSQLNKSAVTVKAQLDKLKGSVHDLESYDIYMVA